MNSRPDQKAFTRDRILGSAAQLLRERGIEGTRVADVMAGAGLTVGGFYAHFDSKERLVAETLRALLGARRERAGELRARRWRQRVRAMLDGYLTPAHRDDPASGCPVPAVVGDVARDDTARLTRDALADELDALARTLTGADIGADAEAARQTALGAIALQAGGIVLSRALRGTPLSDEILGASRAFGASALGVNALGVTPVGTRPEDA